VSKQNTTKTCRTLQVSLHAFPTSANDQLQREMSLQDKIDKKTTCSGVDVGGMGVEKTIYLWLYSLFVGPWLLFFIFMIFGREISPSQGRYLHTEQHKHTINAHRHLCFEWDSKPRSQCSSARKRFMPYTTRPL
jgi:hypothetical protein